MIETRMNTAGNGLMEAYLKPGEVYLSAVPARVSTVLGSCISVTLFHRATGLGGICHGVLPEDRGGAAENRYDPRYVDSAIRYLLSMVSKAGIGFDELEVKLFGGAAMMPYSGRACKDLSIGSQNAAMAQHVLKSIGLEISAADVGGIQGRKIVFFTHSGVVWLKRLSKSEMKTDLFGPQNLEGRSVRNQRR